MRQVSKSILLADLYRTLERADDPESHFYANEEAWKKGIPSEDAREAYKTHLRERIQKLEEQGIKPKGLDPAPMGMQRIEERDAA